MWLLFSKVTMNVMQDVALAGEGQHLGRFLKSSPMEFAMLGVKHNVSVGSDISHEHRYQRQAIVIRFVKLLAAIR